MTKQETRQYAADRLSLDDMHDVKAAYLLHAGYIPGPAVRVLEARIKRLTAENARRPSAALRDNIAQLRAAVALLLIV